MHYHIVIYLFLMSNLYAIFLNYKVIITIMKKILVVFNEIVTPARVINFAVQTAKQKETSVQGIFLKDLSVEGNKYSFPNDLQLTEKEQSDEPLKNIDKEMMTDTAQMLKKQSREAGVSIDIQKDVSLRELVDQSADALLLIVDAKIELEQGPFTNTLAHLHCPAYLVGINAPVIENILLAFDGGASADYAINKFAALFPEWTKLPAIVVTSQSSEIKERDGAFSNGGLTSHFSNLTTQVLNGDSEEEWMNLINKHPQNTLVVMSAFTESALSRFFHPGLASKLMNETRISFFIAHKQSR